uniref:HMA domain-containing protein n=1 Tax=Leersia perrieri TaxID=77586 RepID=A0A0D9VPN3_9ORYZ
MPRAGIFLSSSNHLKSQIQKPTQRREEKTRARLINSTHTSGEEEKIPSSMGDEKAVVLRMQLHCAGCAQKVKKSIRHMDGVESVMADAATNTVVVSGTPDAAALKARIEAKTKKPVEIVSAGGGGGGRRFLGG